MRELSSEPPAQWTLYGLPLQKGLALGIGAPLYLPTYGNPIWFDPRLFAQDEDEWHAIEYRMPTEPVEVIGITRDLSDIPPVLAPYVRVVGWIVERAPDPPRPQTPILLVPKLPALLPPEATVVLDANAGVAYIEPSVAVLARYQSQLLRVATHTRYHLEGKHLPVTTWDGKHLQIGCVAVDWTQTADAAQQGAELVWLKSETLPNNIARIAHALGGKPLWLYDPQASARDDPHWQRLLRISAELNLTLLVSDLDALQDAHSSLEVARETLRTEHVPLGRLQIGLQVEASKPFPLVDEESILAGQEPPYAVCWYVSQFTNTIADALWEQHSLVRRLGIRRALILPDAQPETLAIALGIEPQFLFMPLEHIDDAKVRLMRLSVTECREWLLMRLRHWRDPDLRQQPQQWIEQRA
ncbi:MAG: hypothetical protein CFK49_00430 [Armatimonadetes bacterium JP3_11]|nr:MAG: hypothetical protein CFK49_00430 [Armatimonadetes bacterium JP3_11]